MKVLVTGAAGFIGSSLADRLLARGDEVVGVDNLTTGRRDNVSFDVYEEDIADRDVLYGIANRVRPELVVHCAASYSNPDFWHRDTDTNVTGAVNVALAARHHGAAIVYFQTVLPPISSYAISKLAGERYLQLSGQPLATFVLASVYGPRNLSGPVPAFYKRLRAGEPCVVVQGASRDMVFVQDLLDFVLKTVDRGRWGRHDVASGADVQIGVLPDLVARAMGLEEADVIFRPRPDDDVASYRPMRRVPCPTMLEEGIRRAVEWYETNIFDQTFSHLPLTNG